ncbi:cation-transporting P-type ATPase, partial [Morganella morganii]
MTVNVNRTVTPAVRDNNTFPAAVYAAKTPDETLAELHSDMLGLDEIDALDRLIEHQENVVAHDKAPPAFIQFISAFHNPFIYVLLALAVISFMTDYLIPLQQGEETDLTGVLIIGTMVFLSVVLRFWQEYRTNKALMNPLMILVKIIKLRWIHILSYDQMVSRK